MNNVKFSRFLYKESKILFPKQILLYFYLSLIPKTVTNNKDFKIFFQIP